MSITVDYDEMPGSPKESLSDDGIQVVRELKCTWANRLTLAKQALGFVVGGTINPPDEYSPEGNEALNRCYATNVEIEPIVAPSSDTNLYSNAIVTITYQTKDYDVDEPDDAGTTVYVSESFEPATKFITLPTDKLHWDTPTTKDNKLVDTEAPGKIHRILEWVYTKKGLDSLPNAFLTFPGKVNNAAVYSRALDFTWPAETLLCGSPTLSREWTSQGVTKWTVTFRFMYMNNGTLAAPKGWNYFPVTRTVGTLAFSQIYDTGESDPKEIYDTANFSEIVD